MTIKNKVMNPPNYLFGKDLFEKCSSDEIVICCPVGMSLSEAEMSSYQQNTTRLLAFSDLWCTVLVEKSDSLDQVKEIVAATENTFIERNVQVTIQQLSTLLITDRHSQIADMAKSFCQHKVRQMEIMSFVPQQKSFCPCCRGDDQRRDNINGGYVADKVISEENNLLPSLYCHKFLLLSEETKTKGRDHTRYLYETTSISDFYRHDNFSKEETYQLAPLILLLHRYLPEKVNDDYRYLNPPYDNDKSLFDNLRIYSDRLIEVHTASYPRKVAPADLFGRIKKGKKKDGGSSYLAKVLWRLKFQPKEGKDGEAEASLRGHNEVSFTIVNGSELWEEMQTSPHLDNHLRPKAHELATTLKKVLENFCKTFEELGGGGVDSFLKYNQQKHFRSQLFDSIVTHVKNSQDVELSRKVVEFINRFIWMYSQRFVSLYDISKRQPPLICFGTCNRVLNEMSDDDIHGSWHDLKYPSDQFKKRFKLLKEKKERESMFGDKICKLCYNGVLVDLAAGDVNNEEVKVTAVSDV